MDNVTHTLVGLMMARVALRKSPRGAPAMMMIAANIPDIDVASGFGGSLAYIEYHRGYTHSLLASPVMALIPLLLFMAIFRQRPSLGMYFFSWIAVLSHLALDCTNPVAAVLRSLGPTRPDRHRRSLDSRHPDSRGRRAGARAAGERGDWIAIGTRPQTRMGVVRPRHDRGL